MSSVLLHTEEVVMRDTHWSWQQDCYPDLDQQRWKWPSLSLSSNDRTESGQVTWDRPIRGQVWWGLKQYWHCNLHCLSYNELRAKTSFVSDYGCKHWQSTLVHRPRLQAFRFVGVFIIVIGTVGVFRIRAKYRILLPDLLTDAFNKANDKINCFINRRV